LFSFLRSPSPVLGRPGDRTGEVEQHSLPATVAYHPLPGLLILSVTVAACSSRTDRGRPPIAAHLRAILVAQLPIQLGYLRILGWRCNGRLSLAGAVLYCQRLAGNSARFQWSAFLPGAGVLVRGDPDQHRS
jgi:hypothetical protein